MEWKNRTTVTVFLLLGITRRSNLQSPLFLFFLFIYTMTLLGNMGIILAVRLCPNLHTPINFFISSLSFLDVCFSSTVTHKMLADFLVEKKVISFLGCAFQVYFLCALGTTENFLFAVMVLDHYVAICNPLSYLAIMSHNACVLLVSSAYTIGFLHSLIETGCTFRLSFCASNALQHFVSDVPMLLELSCTDTWANELVLFVFISLVTMSSLLAIFVSYAYIIATVLRIRSAAGRMKAFSTCTSHLMDVTLTYGMAFFVYLMPSASMDQKSVGTVFYTVVIPMLDPLIYSLRNNDIKAAIRNIMYRKLFSQCLSTLQ